MLTSLSFSSWNPESLRSPGMSSFIFFGKMDDMASCVSSTEMCLFISPCTEHRYIILRSWDISKLALEDRLVLQLDFHLFLTISLLCYDAILYHSTLKLVFSCTSSSYPLDTYEREHGEGFMNNQSKNNIRYIYLCGGLRRARQ